MGQIQHASSAMRLTVDSARSSWRRLLFVALLILVPVFALRLAVDYGAEQYFERDEPLRDWIPGIMTGAASSVVGAVSTILLAGAITSTVLAIRNGEQHRPVGQALREVELGKLLAVIVVIVAGFCAVMLPLAAIENALNSSSALSPAAEAASIAIALVMLAGIIAIVLSSTFAGSLVELHGHRVLQSIWSSWAFTWRSFGAVALLLVPLIIFTGLIESLADSLSEHVGPDGLPLAGEFLAMIVTEPMRGLVITALVVTAPLGRVPRPRTQTAQQSLSQ